MTKIFANIWPNKEGRLQIGDCYHRYWKGDGLSGANVVFVFGTDGELVDARFLKDEITISQESQNDN